MNQDKALFQKVYERAEIILEIGFTHTRVGFQSDVLPRKILQTQSNIFPAIQQFICSENIPRDDQQRPYDANRLLQDVNDFELKMEEFLHFIFDQEVAITPRDRQIYLIYNYYQQEDIVNNIAMLLFKKFEVSKITFLIANMLPLYLTGHFTGIVVDGGFLQTTMSPIYDGYSLLHHGGSIGLGGMDISANLYREIILENPQILKQPNQLQIVQSPEWIEDVKIRVGRILPLKASQSIQNDDQELIQKMKTSKIQIPIFHGGNVSISYFAVGTIFTNALFGNVDQEQPNIAYNFLKLCKKLHSMDLARKLLSNVVFAGGLCMIPNLINRFREEVHYLLKEEKEFNDIKSLCNDIRISQTQNHPQNLNWVAGSLMTQISLCEKLTLNYQMFKDNGYMLTNKSDGFNFISVQQSKI